MNKFFALIAVMLVVLALAVGWLANAAPPEPLSLIHI